MSKAENDDRRKHYESFSDADLVAFRLMYRQRMNYFESLKYVMAAHVSTINEELSKRVVNRGWEMKDYREDGGGGTL